MYYFFNVKASVAIFISTDNPTALEFDLSEDVSSQTDKTR